MKPIAQIDPNFTVDAQLPQGYEYYDPQEAPFQIYGLVPNKEKTYCRLPLALLPQCSEGVQRLSRHLAGACVRFTTDSPGLCILWELMGQEMMSHMAACGQSGLQLFEESDAGIRSVSNILPVAGMGLRKMQSRFVTLPKGLRSYALYFPLYNGFEQFSLGFAPGAHISKGRTPRIEKPLVFYGSSITQGGCASKVGSVYTTILARRLDAAQINLGFSGNGRGEAHMARYIAGLDMSAFIMDYDHNAPTPQHLQETHYPFYRIIREANPHLPIVMVSRPDFDGKEQDSRKRRDIIMRSYLKAVDGGDENVYFVDGQQCLGTRDRDMCLVDGTHPTDLGFLRMADALELVLRPILYP